MNRQSLLALPGVLFSVFPARDMPRLLPAYRGISAMGTAVHSVRGVSVPGNSRFPWCRSRSVGFKHGNATDTDHWCWALRPTIEQSNPPGVLIFLMSEF